MKKKYFKDFWWNIIKISFRKSFNIFSAIATALGVLILIATRFIPQSVAWREILIDLSWQIPIGVFVGSFFINLFWQPALSFKEKSDKVEKYETSHLQFVVGNGMECIFQRGDNWIFRVGIKTLGRRSVENVEVVLLKRSGREHAFPDAPLRPAYSLPGGLASFIVKPDETRFVEICSWNAKPELCKEVGIHYHTSYEIFLRHFDEKYPPLNVSPIVAPFLIPDRVPIEETITLCVTGDNVKSETTAIKFDFSGKQPKWTEVKLNE